MMTNEELISRLEGVRNHLSGKRDQYEKVAADQIGADLYYARGAVAAYQSTVDHLDQILTECGVDVEAEDRILAPVSGR